MTVGVTAGFRTREEKGGAVGLAALLFVMIAC